ncbi:MAG TPA: hypothetical protein VEZ70_06180 [Allosphingosinicella sp.]|nr:hypothetical protein [Allosphingosinicella sp.]
MRTLGALFLALCALLAWPVYANLCAAPARNGSSTISGVVNTYYAPALGFVSAGATSITLTGSAGAGEAIQAGDLLLVIQMQDATVETRNNSRYGSNTNGATISNGYTAIGQSGRYEYVRAANNVPSGGGVVTFTGGTGGGLVNSYAQQAATSSRGQRSYQVVKVPQYDQATVAGTVAALPWNGSVGGVVAVDAARRLTFSGGTIDASGRGFRGGGGRGGSGGTGSNTDYMALSTNGAHASKGEGIGATPRLVWSGSARLDTGVEGLPGGSFARGAPGNAGGGGSDGNPIANDQNTGGGGGGNGGQGGGGGNAWCPGTQPATCPATGGHGGAPVVEIGVGRIVMGGGGGAGSTNDLTGSPSDGQASSGAAGGGIVLIRAGEIAGNGAVRADGFDASSTILNDANGGGGAGGSILISALRTAPGASILASANGGNGGSNTGAGAPHGPGGGGGGGFVATSSGVSVSASVNGGSNGTTAPGLNVSTSYGASPGGGGSGISISGANIPGLSSGAECTPTVEKSFAAPVISVGGVSRMSITVTNNNPTTMLTALAFTDAYPAELVNTASPSGAISCNSGTIAAAAGAASLALSGGSIAAGLTCTYSVNTTVTAVGAKTNTIPALAVQGNYGSTTVRNLDPASAVLHVSAPLTLVKASQAFSDPVNGTASPKGIPGGFLTYTITVANPGGGTVDSNTIVVLDATPANLQLFVGDLVTNGGPILFQQGSTPSTLTYTFAGLASTADDVDFSNNGGASWTYTPVPNADGVDPAVTHFRVRPKGTMAGSSSFSLQVRYRIN